MEEESRHMFLRGKVTTNRRANEKANSSSAYLNWVLDLQCWNQDGKYESGILVHGAVLGNEEGER